MKKESFFRNPWVVGIGVAIFGAVFSSVWTSVLKKISLLSALGVVFDKVWSFILFCLKYKIPVWSILLFFIIIMSILFLWGYLSSKNQNINNESNLLQYTKDMIKGALFVWEYKLNNEDKYQIKNLQQVCSKCECQVIRSAFNPVRCPNCDNSEIDILRNNREAIEKIIIHNVNTGKYKENKYFKE